MRKSVPALSTQKLNDWVLRERWSGGGETYDFKGVSDDADSH